MTSRRSTARSRDIGLDLFAIREKAGFDGLGLAERLGWDQSKVSRIEGGKQTVDEVDLIHWLTTCKVKSPKLRQLVMRNREANQDTWVLPVGPASSDSRNLVAEERHAKAITMYSCLLAPGLLQTPEYARAVIRLYHPNNDAAVERLVAARTKRQDVLRGEKAPKVVFYIEEAALRRPVGDSQVRHDQLLHLMFMADWKKVSIRVLRTDVGGHVAMDGAFTLIERRDRRWVAFVNVLATAVVLEGDEHIAVYKAAITNLDHLALGEGESRRFIAALADEPGRASDDGPGDVA